MQYQKKFSFPPKLSCQFFLLSSQVSWSDQTASSSFLSTLLPHSTVSPSISLCFITHLSILHSTACHSTVLSSKPLFSLSILPLTSPHHPFQHFLAIHFFHSTIPHFTYLHPAGELGGGCGHCCVWGAPHQAVWWAGICCPQEGVYMCVFYRNGQSSVMLPVLIVIQCFWSTPAFIVYISNAYGTLIRLVVL